MKVLEFGDMENKKQTSGQKMVGVAFNPSQDNKVDRIKEKAAALLDEIHDQSNEAGRTRPSDQFHSEGIKNIVTGVMWAVKGTTWKD